MDDDTFVNTRALLALLKDPKTPQEKLYMGRVKHVHCHIDLVDLVLPKKNTAQDFTHHSVQDLELNSR